MAASDTGKIIGGIIRDYRKSKGLKQSDLAMCMGVDFQVISDYERGRRTPGIDWVDRACDCLQVDISDFFASYRDRKKQKSKLNF